MDPQKTMIAVALASAIAVPAEGLRQWAYNDSAGGNVITVCYGSRMNVDVRHKYSTEECKQKLSVEMQYAVEAVEQCSNQRLPAHQLAALADAVYNLGTKVVCDKRRSTLARLLWEGKVIEACNQLPRWNHGTVAGVKVPLPGLTARREKERVLCTTGVLV